MNINEIKDRTDVLIGRLYQVWEKSVQATHTFLTEEEIGEIAKWVPAALRDVPHLIVAADKADLPIAFMGIDGTRLEMLFITPGERGRGIGKQLLLYGIRKYGVSELCVNEQNPQARAFYEHMGFQVYKRTNLDEQGNPYPLLYMKCDPKAADYNEK